MNTFMPKQPVVPRLVLFGARLQFPKHTSATAGTRFPQKVILETVHHFKVDEPVGCVYAPMRCRPRNMVRVAKHSRTLHRRFT